MAVARHLGPGSKGTVTLLVTAMTFFLFISNILGGQTLIYLVPRNNLNSLVKPAYLFSILIAIVGYLVLLVTNIIPSHFIEIICLSGLLASITHIHQSILFGKQKIKKANVISVIPVAIQTAGILLCFYVLHYNNVNAFALSLLGSYAFTTVFSFFWVQKDFSVFPLFKNDLNAELIKSFYSGVQFQLIEILQLVNFRLYFFILGAQQGLVSLGVYSVGISILEAVWIIPRSISTVHYVSISNTEEIKKESVRTIQLLKTSLLITGMILILISLVPAQVYAFVFGKSFEGITHSIRFLFPGIWVYNFVLVISSFYLGTGRYKPLIVTHLAGVVTLIIASLLLIPQYYMSGAGLAATVSFIVAALVSIYFFRKDMKAG